MLALRGEQPGALAASQRLRMTAAQEHKPRQTGAAAWGGPDVQQQQASLSEQAKGCHAVKSRPLLCGHLRQFVQFFLTECVPLSQRNSSGWFCSC